VAAAAAYLAEKPPVHQVALVVEPRGEEMALVALELLVKVTLVVLAVLVTQSIQHPAVVELVR
jgi:hypothetical protein